MNSAQGSITVKRLRNGSSIFLTLDKSIDLHQGVDTETGVVSPDWTVVANRPIITPNVKSARGYAVVLSLHTWKRAGLAISFTVDNGNGTYSDASGTYKMNVATGALTITKNLASVVNTGNDTLTYSCVATVQGVEYSLTKDVDISLQNTGASSYYGSIIATTEQLNSDVTSTLLSTKLFLAISELTDYYVKWYKDTELWSAMNGQKSITVTRDDVNGTQLFVAEFYKNQTDTTPVYRAGVRIIDSADDFQIGFKITSTNVEVDTDKPVTVQGYIINMSKNTTLVPTSPIWRLDVMDKDTWTVLRSVASDTVTITTADTDRNSKLYDIDVSGEVQW